MSNKEEADWLVEFVLVGVENAADVAHRFVTAGGTVRSRLLLWALDDQIARYTLGATMIDLYRRRLAGDEPSADEWASIARLGALEAKNNERFCAKKFVGLAASAPDHLVAILQALGGVVIAYNPTEFACDAWNARVADKIVRLLEET